MELFAAGDESQMDVIKRWIDTSDVFMLILGGRYGSIEPKSQISYIEIEYKYAVAQNKPFFALVLDEKCKDERFKKLGLNSIEQEHPTELKEFRELVGSKIVSFWCEPKDIKLAIMETIAQLNDRTNLIGWIPATESINAGAIAEELARLTKESSQLKEQIERYSRNIAQLDEQVERYSKENVQLREQLDRSFQTKYFGLTFVEMYEQLNRIKLFSNEVAFFDSKDAEEVVKNFGDIEFSILHAYWMLSEWLQRSDGLVEKDKLLRILNKLKDFDLIQKRNENETSSYLITQTGKEYLIRLKKERDLDKAEKFILS
jgi:DNA-binding PadR family transcriptional regulator